MKKLYFKYLNTFKGLSREVWWLALITLINRAGTMVIPFLSLYLIKSLNFTLKDVGWIMTCFGLGSVLGSWIGGKLTDKIGFYKVIKASLFLTGLLFIALQFVTSFVGFCIGIFLVMLVADTFRPAMFVALSTYSKPENKTRSVTLIRLAINLGFSVGPALGGLIITSLSYSGLFWVDGITCISATFLLMNVLNPKKARTLDELKVANPISIFKDTAFWLFFVGMFIFALVFLQLFSTIPLYYKQAHHLSELQIGLLMAMNGFIIFALEMPLIKWLEESKYSKEFLIFIGLFLMGLSFFVLNLTSWSGILILGMFFMTFGEMIALPFSNAFVINRAKKGNQGEYMAYYSIAFSLAHIFGHNSGMRLIDAYDFDTTWSITTITAVVGLVIFLLLMRMVKKEKA
ncbi:MFS transporter [Tenacibaculum finnmarkense]|uniref:MDR family MFS transporter n=1 Tax=Tenacibaculum finnmarkense TaxID=2781243 RepID=UPI001EFA9DEC|nr:MFS transporter [Tenacibaculum finnmarkense]MCG8881893.1 MFS transporter [Tenacibaculum finnmarkense]